MTMTQEKPQADDGLVAVPRVTCTVTDRVGSYEFVFIKDNRAYTPAYNAFRVEVGRVGGTPTRFNVDIWRATGWVRIVQFNSLTNRPEITSSEKAAWAAWGIIHQP